MAGIRSLNDGVSIACLPQIDPGGDLKHFLSLVKEGTPDSQLGADEDNELGLSFTSSTSSEGKGNSLLT